MWQFCQDLLECLYRKGYDCGAVGALLILCLISVSRPDLTCSVIPFEVRRGVRSRSGVRRRIAVLFLSCLGSIFKCYISREFQESSDLLNGNRLTLLNVGRCAVDVFRTVEMEGLYEIILQSIIDSKGIVDDDC